jgi:uncharacterized protein
MPNFAGDPATRGTILGPKDAFCFACHPGVPCFTRCCRDADMYLYPYDLIRLKQRLGISSGELLQKHTLTAYRDNPHFPSVMLKMSCEADKRCPFLDESGCRVYADRPFSCRAYPLERAVARSSDGKNRTACWFVARHDHCKGHEQTKQWQVQAWLQDQQLEDYNDMNDLWVDMDSLFRRNPWGEKGVESPALKMAFMACFNVDTFRSFIFESTFLSRFTLPENRIQVLEENDVELMKFGFDWVRYFLTGQGPLEKKTAP